ncbi:hypothetical protein HAX54_020097 [Datura stramonium]|uniref:Uncharacterized protein n=1 Tax=Datura stramonium TaxID=4076 RepID=A0ABS8UST9_DATST|nr:hypothetical protein [Datura stramonium]
MPTEVQIIESANVNSISIEEEMFFNQMDIKELLEFEWSPEIQEVIVTVKSKISEIEDYFGWYYISCNESVDVLLDDREDLEEELYVSNGAKKDVNVEFVNFENNRVMWLPPKPEDEEDEKKALIYDDDDDGGDDVGEWGLWSSRSFESGEYRSRDRPNEEQENVVKNVVDGHFRALGMDHLKMVVAKIDVHQPDVLLVEKSVSHYAQENLLAEDRSLVLTIKRTLLERIAHCTAYHLALETSFLANEGPSELPLSSPIIVALLDKSSTIGRSISIIPGFTIPYIEKTQSALRVGAPQISYNIPTTDLIKIANLCAQKMGLIEFPNQLLHRKSFFRPHLIIKAF